MLTKTANITIDKDLNIHKISGFEGFNRENTGTQFIRAELDGWLLEDGCTLHISFEFAPENYNDTFLMSYDFETKLYYTEVPKEVISVEGEWKMQIKKRYNWNEETGLADNTVAGDVDTFTIKYGVRDEYGNAVTQTDLTNLYLTSLEAAKKAREHADAAEQASKELAEMIANGFTGKSVYIRYSKYADGRDMTEDWTSGQNYIGTYTGTSASEDHMDYNWMQFIGDVLCENDDTFTEININLENNTDKTFTAENITNLNLTIMSDIYHGFTSGIMFKSGNLPPQLKIINNSDKPLKLMRYSMTVQSYTPSADCTVLLGFFCDGTNVYCYINEVT